MKRTIMKRKIIQRATFLLIVLLCAGTLSADAQTWNEWFHQNKTQKKYLLAQIAALEIYVGQLKKGFTICQQGLQFIHEVKNGEFTLHSLFFSSLKKVNPQVIRYAHVAEIIANQAYILANYKKVISAASACGQFNADELQLISECFANLIGDVSQTLDDLLAVTTDGKIEMTDDERLKRIEAIYLSSSTQRDNLHRMETDLRSMALVRQKEKGELDGLSRLLQP